MTKFILICCLLFSNFFWGQHKEVKIDFEELGSKVTIIINDHRKRLKAVALHNENSLQKAAQDHSNYLAKTGTLSHVQNESNKKNPIDRVHFYNGKIYNKIGENVLFNTIEPKKYEAQDLDKLAIKFLINGKTHLLIIKT